MSVTVGVLFTVITLIALRIVWRRAHRLDPQTNLNECKAEFDDAEHDLAVATELRDNRGQRTWAELCRELGHKGRNPALNFMKETPDGDEPAAQDFFETAVTKLEQVHAKAGENLEMAESLADDENEGV